MKALLPFKSKYMIDFSPPFVPAMNDAGMAAEQVQRFLSTMNLPWLSQRITDERQKEIQVPLDSVVNTSLDDSLEEEKKISDEEYVRIIYYHYVTCW